MSSRLQIWATTELEIIGEKARKSDDFKSGHRGNSKLM